MKKSQEILKSIFQVPNRAMRSVLAFFGIFVHFNIQENHSSKHKQQNLTFLTLK